MRIQIVNPNATQAMTDKIRLAAQAVALEGTQIIARNVAHGPETIECAVDEVLASAGVLDVIRQGEQEGVDAHIVACFGDPALDAARELSSVPVIGIAGAAFQMVSLVCHRFAVVTTRKRTVLFAENLLLRYGFQHQCSGVYASDLAVADCEDNPEAGFESVRQDAVQALQDGAEAIVLGCAGMADWVERLRNELQVPVIDGVQAAVTLAESLQRLNVGMSKVGQYGLPFEKRFVGRYEHFSS